jgi:hypothetical protein
MDRSTEIFLQLKLVLKFQGLAWPKKLKPSDDATQDIPMWAVGELDDLEGYKDVVSVALGPVPLPGFSSPLPFYGAPLSPNAISPFHPHICPGPLVTNLQTLSVALELSPIRYAPFKTHSHRVAHFSPPQLI